MRILITAVVLLACLCVFPTESFAQFDPFGAGSSVEEAEELVDFESAGVRMDAAYANLEERFDGFLDREPLGFDRNILDRFLQDFSRWWWETRSAAADISEASALGLLGSAAPVWILLATLLLMTFLTRQVRRRIQRMHSQLYVGFSRSLTRLTRVAVITFGSLVPVMIVLCLTYFPVQAVFGRSDWTLLLTQLFWLVLWFRMVEALLSAFFSLGFLKAPATHATRLYIYLASALRVIFAYWMLLAAIDILDLSEELRAFARFAYEISMVLVVALVIFGRKSVLAVIPRSTEHTALSRTHNFLDRNFGKILSITLLLLVLKAMGYDQGAGYLLTRGYGVLVLVMGVYLVSFQTRRWLRELRGRADQRDHADLIRGIEWMSGLAFLLIAIVVGMKMLGVWDAFVIVTTGPLVRIGRVSISIFSVLQALVVLGAAILFARVFRAILVSRIFPILKLDVGIGYAINVLLNYAMVLAGVFFALVALGVNLSALTVLMASLGVGIGFGLQTITENLVSGFILLFGRSVKKGDFITVDDVFGQVDAVGARSVVLRTPDNFEMLVPSKEIVGGRIINWSYRDPIVRLHIPIGVSYKHSPRQVQEVLLSAVEDLPLILKDPPPKVWLSEFGDSSINYAVLVYIDVREATPRSMRSEVNYRIWDALAAAKLEIPFPQRDVHIKEAPVKADVGEDVEDV